MTRVPSSISFTCKPRNGRKDGPAAAAKSDAKNRPAPIGGECRRGWFFRGFAVVKDCCKVMGLFQG